MIKKTKRKTQGSSFCFVLNMHTYGFLLNVSINCTLALAKDAITPSLIVPQGRLQLLKWPNHTEGEHEWAASPLLSLSVMLDVSALSRREVIEFD